MRSGRFCDPLRGNGVQVSAGRWTLALRWRWHLYLVRPPGKPGYVRLYLGPLEIERRGGQTGGAHA